jgi:uncharacterized membrane protein
MLPFRSAGRLRQSLLWLLLWTLLGASLRLTNLDGKPPWTEEFRTLVLSLGNSFQSVPLDRVISFQELLAPLIPNPSATLSDAIARVSIEDRQPPIYFILAHLWMRLFPPSGGLVNLWGARALPAGLGILTIPCIYICSYWTFRQSTTDNRSALTIANFTAAMFAVSPYGIFIAQEARQYSLAILWMTISINCLAIACRYFFRRQKLPILLMISWVSANILGMGTHYLFGIALIAEIMTLGFIWVWQLRQNQLPSDLDNSRLIDRPRFVPLGWRRLSLAIVGTIAGAALWWWLFASTKDPFATDWINNQPHKLIEVFNPFFQVIGASISMMSLLLVEASEFVPISILSETPTDINIPIVFLSAILMLMFFAWAIPMLRRGVRFHLRQPNVRIETLAIASFTMCAIGLYLVIPWFTGIDITRGARYHFVYFPGLMMVVGLGLASCWQHKPSIAKWVSGKQAVTIVLSMGLVSSTIVATNYGYHKYYRPEQIVPKIAQSAPVPVLIVTTHNSIVQVGEMMGLAWEMRRINALSPKLPQQINLSQTQFLLVSQFQKFCDSSAVRSDRDCRATKILRETVDRLSHSIDLWLINFYAPAILPPTCERDKRFTRGVYGYQYQLYHCQPIEDPVS